MLTVCGLAALIAAAAAVEIRLASASNGDHDVLLVFDNNAVGKLPQQYHRKFRFFRFGLKEVKHAEHLVALDTTHNHAFPDCQIFFLCKETHPSRNSSAIFDKDSAQIEKQQRRTIYDHSQAVVRSLEKEIQAPRQTSGIKVSSLKRMLF
uniref:Uncharacterized protein n=1 Tax=Glossina austeni TaxID=7395 RepID=A0A1A9UL48_GLOAU